MTELTETNGQGDHNIIYVTGDTHGRAHRDKLDAISWPAGQGLGRDDYVVVCGDFAGVFGPAKRDEDVLGWWESRPWTTLFVDGNHENHDALDAMDTEERFGGKVHVIHLMRGYVFDLPLSKTVNSKARVLFGGVVPIDDTSERD